MPPLLTIALLTLREAVRRRLLLAVVILTVAAIAFTGWGFSRLTTLTVRNQPMPHSELMLTVAEFVVLLAYMFSVVLAIGAAFLAAPAIGADVESGLVLAMLPRPIRRSDLVLGKWLGLAALISVFAVVAGGIELLIIKQVTGYVPPNPGMAVLYIMGQSLVVLTLAMLGSTRLSPMTCGIVVVVLFGVAWIAGIAEGVGLAFDNKAIADAGTVVGLLIPTDGLWRGAVYHLTPAIVRAVEGTIGNGAPNPFMAITPPGTPLVLWTAAWVVAILGLATLRFSRRDL